MLKLPCPNTWRLFSEPEQEYSINIEVNNKKEIKINLFIGRHNMNFLSVNYDILTCNILARLQSSISKIDQTVFGRHNTEETVFVYNIVQVESRTSFHQRNSFML